GRPDRFGKAKATPQLLRDLLSAHVCFSHDAGTQAGLASTEGCSSDRVGSATGATNADTRVFWHAVTDAIEHAFQEKGKRETQEEKRAQITSGFPQARCRRLRAAVLDACNVGTRIWQVANIAKCRAM